MAINVHIARIRAFEKYAVGEIAQQEYYIKLYKRLWLSNSLEINDILFIEATPASGRLATVLARRQSSATSTSPTGQVYGRQEIICRKCKGARASGAPRGCRGIENACEASCAHHARNLIGASMKCGIFEIKLAMVCM